MTTDTNSLIQADERVTEKFRLLGLLPLMFFLAQLIHYWRLGELGHVLWICNIGNLILAIGLFTDRATLIRVAFLWAIPGVVVWFIYVVLAWGIFLSSTLAHVGGLIVALFVIRRVGMARWAWIYAVLWYLLLQGVCRWLTPADLNVNVAHRIQPGWEQVFGSYWEFWLVLTIAVTICLWLLGWALEKVVPPKPNGI